MMEQKSSFKNSLTVGFINIRGQSKLNIEKQLQIEDFLKRYKCDILHLQETNIENETFSSCCYISNNYNIIHNNSLSQYGTASLVKSEFLVENVRCDSDGRVLIFDIQQMTFVNLYLHSGTDAIARAGRENICGEVLPNLLINSKEYGCAGGDLNCIIEKKDATKYPEAKMSNCLKRLVKVRGWKDSFRYLHPTIQKFSRYYENSRAYGASRIDRCYHYGNIMVEQAIYVPLAFSDHFAHVVEFLLPDNFSFYISPKSRPSFRLRAEVIQDQVFKERLAASMEMWERVMSFQENEEHSIVSGILSWWELLVKPGIRKLALDRTKEMFLARKEVLNLLLIRQAYLTRKLQLGMNSMLGELKKVHLLIESWYQKESEKVQHQSRLDEFQRNEKTTLYHHELLKKVIKKSSILKLQTDMGLLEGHDSCAKFLEQTVEDLLLHPADLDMGAQDTLLKEIDVVFSEQDNQKFLTSPTRDKVFEVLSDSNLLAAPGTDGIPGLLYKEHWDLLGDHITEIMTEIFKCKDLPNSMNTSLMVFGSKPKKPGSLLPKDKRRISLLNSDFKIASGLEASHFKSVATHTLSHLQLVAGDDRRIHHGINMARDAIHAAGRNGHPGCGILDTDLIAAFDWLCLDWTFKVLEKKGLDKQVISRLKNLYSSSVSIVVVNNVHGKSVNNIRGSLRQGDLPSMHLFSYGIDPLLIYLEKRLHGIVISSTPVQGPIPFLSPPLRPYEERYRVIGYADDVKPAITTMQEFLLVDQAMTLFENASGCKLHRDPANKKCKFLPLARWRGTLDQDDIPCNYMTISDHLEMVGVELRATWAQTRKANGDIVQQRVADTVKLWKTGKFMHLSLRSWSLNIYCFSKIWFRTHSVDLRESDFSKITSSAKSWLYADMLLKPEETVLHRPVSSGGLALLHVKSKALAGLIRCFLETACIPKFRQSLYHQLLFRFHVLEDRSIENPGFPPYYNNDFFSVIRQVHLNTPLNVAQMSEKQWYQLLLESKVTMVETDGDSQLVPCRAELKFPEFDWESTWSKSRLHGLGSELMSFLFKVLHDILPTQERIARTNVTVNGNCKLCISNDQEDLLHALIRCPGNQGIGLAVINCLPGERELQDHHVLKLQLDLEEPLELPEVWFLAAAWNSLWESRRLGKRPLLYKVRAELEAKVSLLRETRHSEAAEKIASLISKL